MQSKASLRGYNAFFRPDFPQEPSVLVLGHAYLQHSRPEDLQARPCSLGASFQYHAKWSPTNT